MTDEESHLIEQYAYRPDQLTAGQRERVEDLCQADAEARAWLDRMQAYYAMLKDSSSNPTATHKRDQQITQMVDELFASRPTIHVRRPPEIMHQTIIAAQTHPERRFRATSLVNRDEQVLLRVLKDRKASVHRLYLLTEDLSGFPSAMVMIGDHPPVVLDENGWGRVPATDGSDPTDQHEAWIHRPVWHRPLQRLPVGTQERARASTGHRFIVRRTADGVHVQETLRPANQNPLFGAALRATDDSGSDDISDAGAARSGFRFDDGNAFIPVSDRLSSRLTLLIYG